jgi:hypothetical protein
MTSLRKNLGWLVVLSALCIGGAASAQRYYYYGPGYYPPPPPRYEVYYSPIAFNAWAGLSLDFAGCFNCVGPFDQANTYLGAALGGDFGVHLSRRWSLVGLAEYDPIFGSSGTADLISIGGGFRFDPSPYNQLLFGISYSQTNYAGFGSESGLGFHFMSFFPLGNGFGPYVEFVGRQFYDNAGNPSDAILSFGGGISYSF